MIKILHGDCVKEMRKLPAESVHCIITSPPYWRLRDYQIPPSVWGGQPECPHEWQDRTKKSGGAYKAGSKKRWQHSAEAFERDDRFLDGHPDIPAGATCVKCNAWRGVFGLEPTPELYLEHLVSIMSEARRVLRNDGTLWLNLGDSYATTSTYNAPRTSGGEFGRIESSRQPNDGVPIGLKAGDLVGIPWRAALALQADGWFLRRDNIWFKPNPVPESVNGWRWEKHRIKTKAQERGVQGSVGNSKRTRDMSNGQYLGSAEYVDCSGCEKCAPNGGLILRKGNWRCTTSHEYVFQFSKSSSYFCDAEAAKEVTSGTAHARGNGVNPKAKAFGPNSRVRVDRDPSHQTAGRIQSKQNRSFSAAVVGLVGNRNRRSVWRIATKPCGVAHFATFPPDLVRPIILAATPVKCCALCAAPYAPVILRGEPDLDHQRACGGDENGEYHPSGNGKYFDGTRAENARTVKQRILAGMVTKKVVGYRATCSCVDAAPTPAVVLDMFGGSGTVGQVAQEEDRSAILIELSAAYIPLIEKRTNAPVLAV